ncbi:MAG: ABC transporter permease [Pseudomonadota bacterium]|uniref:ABC transporter permease n=1 Tax=Sphingobium sp. TaxID=1912891 RepID=UPI002E1C2A40
MSNVYTKKLPSAVSLLEGVRVQGSVIGALLMRELHTRYGKRGLGYVWLFLEPMLLAVMVVSLKLVSHERHYGRGISVVAFIILGYTIFIMFRGIWNRSDKALDSNLPLMYHRMVSVFDILMSRALLEAVASLMAFFILQGLCIMLEMGDWPARPIYFLTGFLQYFWFSYSLSMIVCAASYENPTVEKFIHPISYILMPLSGAFFMVDWFPDRFHGLIAYWPMASVFEEMRYGWFEQASDQHFYPLYVCSICMVLTLVGLLAIKLVRRKVELK